MTGKRKPKPDNPEQSKRFVETAKDLGVDESGKEFARAINKVISPEKKPAKLKKETYKRD